MKDCNYIPNGNLQGDTNAMPDRGTKTGMPGQDPMIDGMSIDVDATNRIVGISGSTKSDPMGDGTPDAPAV